MEELIHALFLAFIWNLASRTHSSLPHASLYLFGRLTLGQMECISFDRESEVLFEGQMKWVTDQPEHTWWMEEDGYLHKYIW